MQRNLVCVRYSACHAADCEYSGREGTLSTDALNAWITINSEIAVGHYIFGQTPTFYDTIVAELQSCLARQSPLKYLLLQSKWITPLSLLEISLYETNYPALMISWERNHSA